MQHLFAPYIIASLAKEKGFKGQCLMYYYSDKPFDNHPSLESGNIGRFAIERWQIGAPTHKQLTDWLRDTFKIEFEVHCIRFHSARVKGYQYAVTSDNYTHYIQKGNFNTHLEAWITGMTETLNLLP